MCYRFTFSERKKFSHYSLAYALRFPSLYFEIELRNQLFGPAQIVKVILHDGGYPDTSAAYAPVLPRKYNIKTKKALISAFRSTYKSVSIVRLPPPYPTMCVQDSAEETDFSTSLLCTARCLTNYSIGEFNKWPFSVLSINPVKYKHLSVFDLTNSTSSASLYTMREMCQTKCNIPDCKEDYTITNTIGEAHDGGLVFSVSVPREPSFKVVFKPKLPLAEFTVYVLSCVGTW